MQPRLSATISSVAPLSSDSDSEDDFEFCYRFRPLYAEDAGGGRAQEEEGAPWMSGSGIHLQRRPSSASSVGSKGSYSDSFVPLARHHDQVTRSKERAGDDEDKDGGEIGDGEEKSESEAHQRTKRRSAPPATCNLDKRVRDRLGPGASDGLDNLLITEEDERETMTITRAQWKRWQHQEAYVIALTRELERLQQLTSGASQAATPRPTAQGESEKDRKMREFKEMMAARYSNIRTNAEGHKAQVIVDYYANRLEQRQKNVLARAGQGEGESGSPSTTPRGKSGKRLSLKKGGGGGSRDLSSSSSGTSALTSSPSGSSLLARFKKNS